MTTAKNNSRAGLLNLNSISTQILREAPWADSHGADPSTGFLGSGLLYYTLTYMLKARFCVCIGSGGGFVPRLMRQAQRDLAISDSRTILIDADRGEWGRPQWLENESFFHTEYQDIEIFLENSSKVFRRPETFEWKIDYLHIDGDHSHEGSLRDFENYQNLLSPRGIITFHDTRPYNYYNVTCWKSIRNLQEAGYQVLDFPWIGDGIAIIQPRQRGVAFFSGEFMSRRYLFNFISTILHRLKSPVLSRFRKS